MPGLIFCRELEKIPTAFNLRSGVAISGLTVNKFSSCRNSSFNSVQTGYLTGKPVSGKYNSGIPEAPSGLLSSEVILWDYTIQLYL
jgi:hypothetical protein